MLKKTHIILVFIVLLFIFGLTACGSSEPEPTATPLPEATEAQTEDAAVAESETETEAPTATAVPEPTATAEPEPTADLSAGFTELVSENTGITVRYPGDWAMDDNFMLMLASDPEMMAGGEDFTSGALLVAFNGPIDEFESPDPTDILEVSSDTFDLGEDSTMSDIEALTINGQDAAKATVTGVGDSGIPLTALVHVIVNGENVVIMMAATPTDGAEEYVPVLEAIASSVTVSAPSTAVGGLTDGTDADETGGVTPVFPVPAGFAWRIGGEGMSGAADGQFAALSGMDVGPGDILYVADNIHGIYSVYPDGGLLTDVITHPDMNNAADVHVDYNGLVYVAAWGNSEVFVFAPTVDGYDLVLRFGEEGNGPGQFAFFSPQALTVDYDGNIYVLDDNEDDAGEEMVRIQVFSPEGEYLREFPIVEDFFAASDIEFGSGPDANGNLYVLGFIGGYILQLNLETGEVQARLAEDALSFAGPQRFVKEGDYFYVSTWTPSGVMKLDADGNLVSQFGVEVELDASHLAWPEGGFVQPIGVASDGTMVYANDTNGVSTYITGFEMP